MAIESARERLLKFLDDIHPYDAIEAEQKNHAVTDLLTIWDGYLDIQSQLTAQTEELQEFSELFDIQRTRTQEATKFMQAVGACDKDTLPDLGRLLDWLMQTNTEQAVEIERLREKNRRYLALCRAVDRVVFTVAGSRDEHLLEEVALAYEGLDEATEGAKDE